MRKSIAIILLCVSTLVAIKNFHYNFSKDQYYFTTPFSVTAKDFSTLYTEGMQLDSLNQKNNAKKAFQKALTYRNSRNEKLERNLHSCRNSLDERRYALALIYATCYEKTQDTVNAIACLKSTKNLVEGNQETVSQRINALSSNKP